MDSQHLDHTWTAGAQRVWQTARHCAAGNASAMLTVEHLLWALLVVESRAAERLERVGVCVENLPHGWQNPIDLIALPTAEGQPLPNHELVEAVLIEARNIARQDQPGGELGTEHLLTGLMQVPSAVATWLAEFPWQRVASEESPVHDLSSATAPESPTAIPQELTIDLRETREIDLVDTYRILDAAANRAREGLRVVEDFVRWTWNDAFLSEQLKHCRHELAAILRQLPTAEMWSARDTVHDVGTEIRTASEYLRASPGDVATASLKRIEEALRSLEEFSKVVAAELAPRFEQLRYRIYTLDKAIHTVGGARQRLAEVRICLLATNGLCQKGLGPAVLGALKAGVSMIQLREKSLPDPEILQLARYVRQWTRDAGALFIMNDRPDLAVLADADGVHVGQDDLPVAAARRILGPGKLVGVSTHSLEQARQAVLDGADYLGVGPCFPSATKQFADFPGLEFVRAVAGELSIPWLAIGGITAENLPELRQAGADRIAVSQAICGSEEPQWDAAELLFRLQN